MLSIYEETGSVEKTTAHFHRAPVLTKGALAYAKAFAEEIRQSQEVETDAAPVVG